MKKKVLCLLVGIVILVGAVAGCSKSEEQNGEMVEGDVASGKYGLKMETITVATSPGYEPFIFDKDGEMQGYDVDIWKEFEKRSGVIVKWERADFSGLLGLLQSGKADVVAAQMTPTPEREENFDFTEPETYYGSVVVVHEENEEIKSVNDLAGKKVGVGSGNDMQQTVEAMYPNGEVAFEVYTSATLENMLKDLEYKRIDALLAQDIQAYVALKKSGVKCKVITPPFESSVGCLVVNKGEKELLDGINEFLKEIKEDGTLSEISNKWIGADISTEGK